MTDRFVIRWPDEDIQRIRDAADHEALTVADYIRYAERVYYQARHPTEPIAAPPARSTVETQGIWRTELTNPLDGQLNGFNPANVGSAVPTEAEYAAAKDPYDPASYTPAPDNFDESLLKDDDSNIARVSSGGLPVLGRSKVQLDEDDDDPPPTVLSVRQAPRRQGKDWRGR